MTMPGTGQRLQPWTVPMDANRQTRSLAVDGLPMSDAHDQNAHFLVFHVSNDAIGANPKAPVLAEFALKPFPEPSRVRGGRHPLM